MSTKTTKTQKKGRKHPNRQTTGKEAYRWDDRERDPEMLFLIEKMNEDSRSLAKLALDAGLSDTTLRNWEDGKTRQPQNASITFMAHALGFRRAFVDKTTKRPVIVPLWEDRVRLMEEKLEEAAKGDK